MRDKVAATAATLGLRLDVQRLEASTRTVKDAADAVGCGAAQIAKSIVFVCDGEPVVCVASGEHRIDPDKVAEAIDCAEVQPASGDHVSESSWF